MRAPQFKHKYKQLWREYLLVSIGSSIHCFYLQFRVHSLNSDLNLPLYMRMFDSHLVNYANIWGEGERLVNR